MTVIAQINLDEKWDKYKDLSMGLFVDDLFSKFLEKDGIKNVTITNIKF